MDNLNLKMALDRLESDALSEQAAALDEAAAILKEFGRRLVDRFVRSDDRFIIWERLARFGPFVIDPLKEVLSQTEDPELRGLSAMVLLKLGNRTGVSILLNIISSDDVLLCHAAATLSEAQVAEAGDRIIDRLRTLKFSEKLDIYGIQCLLVALKKLGRTLPSDLVEHLQSSDAPWEVRIYAEKLYSKKLSE